MVIDNSGYSKNMVDNNGVRNSVDFSMAFIVVNSGFFDNNYS